MICTPRQFKLPCLQITDHAALKKLHSTLYKYKDTEFVCEQGAPTVGGWLVQQNGRMEYVTEAKFKLQYELLEQPIIVK